MKKSCLYIAAGLFGCLTIVSFSLSIYSTIKVNDDSNNQYQASTPTTKMRETSTKPDLTTPDPGPQKNNGTQRTPLDDYVFSNESLGQFSWERAYDFNFNRTDAITNTSFNAYVLNMTSGMWLTEADVGIRTHWWHCFIVIIPDNLKPEYESHGFIWVVDGWNTDNDDTGMPDEYDEYVLAAAGVCTGIGVPCALLYQVPNQSIKFASDPDERKRSEDSIVAYSWAEYLKNMSHPELNVYFPMARAAVRSMDAMTEYMDEEFAIDVNRFIFVGFSKRGWTTWLAGALDPERVEAIIPGVWDAINIQDIFKNQWRSFNGWSFAIDPYVENNILTKLTSPDLTELQNMIDPYFYRARLTMPKLVITGIMDEFQMADDEQYWWDEMPSGPTGTGLSDGNTKWLVKSPNAEHTMFTNIRVGAQAAGIFVSYLLNGWEIPYLTWDYDPESGDVTAHTFGGEVVSAQMWSAVACNEPRRRDFRAASLDDPCCGVKVDDEICAMFDTLWHKTELDPNADGTSYTGHLEPDPYGKFSAFVLNIQMITNHTFDLDDHMHTFFTTGDRNVIINRPEPFWPSTPPGAFEFSSRASVVPNIFPYPPCAMEGCAGPLV